MDKQTVKKVARLARIRLNDEQVEKLVQPLSNIMGFVEQLGEVDTDNVEPQASVVDITLPLREDVANDGDCPEKVLANAPEQTQEFFVVPKVVE